MGIILLSSNFTIIKTNLHIHILDHDRSGAWLQEHCYILLQQQLQAPPPHPHLQTIDTLSIVHPTGYEDRSREKNHVDENVHAFIHFCTIGHPKKRSALMEWKIKKETSTARNKQINGMKSEMIGWCAMSILTEQWSRNVFKSS